MVVLKCGLDVTIKHSKIKAIITAISIRFDSVKYELSYTYNGDYKTIWVNENEFNIHKTSTLEIGYKKLN